ncbi:group 1 truncated hemoglobin [Sneathiella chungangensis]|uniref:Group 1 truncated hemoglobin n=1 Tax=Sneathiella chungangensis TaxID=1418234 RepID=A0A845MGL4_9PROT|nr:group 1 truncated hemoglobin [Sneathiella chungangensis]MZR22194.1 group 1 truncated hemoglobin [Sneathiella chungangensis]
MAKQSLFEKYGGFSTVSKIVLDFYDVLLDSDDVGPFFDDIDMARLIDHQTKFIASLLGGPASYTDEQLHRLHERLNLENSHFDEVVETLSDTLKKHSFSADDVAAVRDALEQRRSAIVSNNVD